MNNYEKPIAEILDFSVEQIMNGNSGGIDEGFSMGGGNEPL